MVTERIRLLLVGSTSFVAVALVFAAAGGLIPHSILPYPPEWFLEAIPHINVVLSLSAIGTIIYGWQAIKQRQIEQHKFAMLLTLALFATFLTLYLYRLIVLGGPSPYTGPETLYQFVYLPVLFSHIVFAVVCIPLVFEALSLAITRPIGDLPNTRHATVGRFAAALWIISFAG